MEEKPECDAECLPANCSSSVTELISVQAILLEKQGMLPRIHRISCHSETHLLGAGKAQLSSYFVIAMQPFNHTLYYKSPPGTPQRPVSGLFYPRIPSPLRTPAVHRGPSACIVE